MGNICQKITDIVNDAIADDMKKERKKEKKIKHMENERQKRLNKYKIRV